MRCICITCKEVILAKIEIEILENKLDELRLLAKNIRKKKGCINDKVCSRCDKYFDYKKFYYKNNYKLYCLDCSKVIRKNKNK